MTSRTPRSSQSPASEGPRLSGVSTRGRPLTKLRTINETAELLNVSPRTVQRLIKSGALLAHRFGPLVRISDGDIAALLAASRAI
jgi:excisionase family DNA binding protein